MDSNKKPSAKIEPSIHNLLSDEFCDKVREGLKLKKNQLSNPMIRKLLKINNELIGQWVVDNSDGFKIKNNGIIIVSKFLPKCLRGDKHETIEAIMNNPKNDDFMKEMFTKRYTKRTMLFGKDHKQHPMTNIHSFFYLYRIIWFNSRNCAFDKAELFQLDCNRTIKDKLRDNIVGGKDYYEWQFSDWRERKQDKKLPPKK